MIPFYAKIDSNSKVVELFLVDNINFMILDPAFTYQLIPEEVYCEVGYTFDGTNFNRPA